MNADWNFSNDKPIYLQITEHIKRLIVSGKLLPGEKIAAVRDLANEAGVNPNTVQRAMATLEQEGLVYSERTNGRFITEDISLIKSLKSELAHDKISCFLYDMQQFGYTKEQIADMILNYKEVIL